ncbi:MAG TPA: hypothetical protein VMB25_17785 [Bryobacteraceae bacterium]|nr:hypothetical protein [Bryobacteraceae bacterium]
MNNPAPAYVTFYVLAASVAAVVTLLWGLRATLGAAGLSANDRRRCFRLAVVLLAAWFFAALLPSWRGFYGGTPTRIPTIELGLLVPILAGSVFYWRSHLLRRIVAAASQGLLVGIQIYRVLGAIFLVLFVSGRMPGVFALPAGIGDVAVGLLAPVIAFALVRGLRGARALAGAWNLLGLADLVVAVTTGFLSSPSPVQSLALSSPNTLITAFPVVMIPVFLVPLAVLLHFASLANLSRAARPAEF